MMYPSSFEELILKCTTQSPFKSTLWIIAPAHFVQFITENRQNDQSQV